MYYIQGDNGNYCAGSSPAVAALEVIAACPAAVAASLERFLSASSVHRISITNQVTLQPKLTRFFFLFDLGYNSFNFRKF
jgi:hypothetical protein